MLVCERELAWPLLWWDHTNTRIWLHKPLGYSQCSSVSQSENSNHPQLRTKQQGDEILFSLIFFVIYIAKKGFSIPTCFWISSQNVITIRHMDSPFLLTLLVTAGAVLTHKVLQLPFFSNSTVIGWSSCKHLSWINQPLPFKNKIAVKPFSPFIFFFQSQATAWLKEKQLQKRRSIQSLQPHTSRGTQTV